MARRYSKAEAALVERANEVDLFAVLRDFFNIDHPAEGKSYKGYCPFGFEHPDGGVTKGWRTYPETNTSYCFVAHGSLPPVRLVSMQKDVSYVKAAEAILSHYGIPFARHWKKRYEEVLLERERSVAEVGDTAYLVEAIHVSLRQHSNYYEAEVEGRLAEPLAQALAELDQLMSDKAKEGTIREWFLATKARLLEVLNGDDS